MVVGLQCHGLQALDKIDKLRASAKIKIQGTKIYGIKEARSLLTLKLAEGWDRNLNRL